MNGQDEINAACDSVEAISEQVQQAAHDLRSVQPRLLIDDDHVSVRVACAGTIAAALLLGLREVAQAIRESGVEIGGAVADAGADIGVAVTEAASVNARAGCRRGQRCKMGGRNSGAPS